MAKKPARLEGTMYRSPRIYLPTKLTDDSSFPFKEGDLLTIRVDGRKLVVQRASKAQIGETPAQEQRQKP